MQVEHLSAAAKLLADGLVDDEIIVLQHVGLHGKPIYGCFIQNGDVPDTAHGHVQGAGNGGGRQGQHVDVPAELLELFLLCHAEPLLLVHDQQSEVTEFDVLAQKTVGTDDHIHVPPLQSSDGLLLLLGGFEAGEHIHVYRKGAHTAGEGLVVLEGKDGGGNQYRHLLAVGHRLEGGTQSHLGLAVAHVAAEQTVHGGGALHIRLDVLNGGELSRGLLVFKGGLEVPLEIVIG